MYSNEEKAIRYVIKAFENMKRVKEDIDLSFHSIMVGFMLKNIGCSEEIVVSGLLHDIIEDTVYSYEDIVSFFGKKIADNVLAVSEDKNITDWKKRKEIFIESLKKQNNDILLIELADKLHNLLSDYDLWLEKGKDAITTLNTTYEMHKWFYTTLGYLFNERLEDNILLSRYNKLLSIYFEL